VPEVRSPTVRRRELGAILRKLREEKGFTAEQAAAQLLISTSKLSRMETGRGVVTARDVRDLCNLYGVGDEAERERIGKLATEGKQQGWWSEFDIPYEDYVGLEAAAIAISDFQSSVIPGLLQTADYARAGHEATMPRLEPDQIEKLIEVKLTRQSLLTKQDATSFAAVLDEAALHRLTGGLRVMVSQLAHLTDVASLPNVTIQVIPFSAGSHPGLESNFNILEQESDAGSAVFVEGLVGSIYLERPDDLQRYREVFRRLQNIALSPRDSNNLIATIRARFAAKITVSP
jgi:transcriptional regulator with XRE-family HTH domain